MPDRELSAHRNKRAAVVFDWGGVLMRTEDYGPRLAWDKRLGLEPGSVETIVHGIAAWEEAQRGQLGLAVYWDAVAQALALPPGQIDQLREDFYRGDGLDRSLVSLIHDLRARGVRVGLLSNNSPDLADIIRRLGLEGLFDAQIISAAIGVMKPEAGAYQAVLAKLAVGPEQALLIDDSPANVDGARAVGMEAVLFRPGMDLRSAVEQWLELRG